jgi:hypothetical protein
MTGQRERAFLQVERRARGDDEGSGPAACTVSGPIASFSAMTFSEIARLVPAIELTDRFESPTVYRFGIEEEDTVVSTAPEKINFLYYTDDLQAADRGSFQMEVIGRAGKAAIIGRNVPMSEDQISKEGFRPYTASARAGTLIRMWDGSPVASEDDRGRIQVLLNVPEHDGDWTRVRFDERGPVGHFCYSEPDPAWEWGVNGVREGMEALFRETYEPIPTEKADSHLLSWMSRESKNKEKPAERRKV